MHLAPSRLPRNAGACIACRPVFLDGVVLEVEPHAVLTHVSVVYSLRPHLNNSRASTYPSMLKVEY